jgi:tRNA A-37 threonylcarbamoyl transferase component Bud32
VGSPAKNSRLVGPGDKLAGKYELIRQLAVGGMAELYLARTLGIEGFEKLVVIKRILPQYMDDSHFVSMFLNEARLAAGLHHPNIAQVFDIGVEQGDYFFSMEYVHGENLNHLAATALDSGVPLSLDAALTLIVGLCAGLHYAHEKLGTDGKPLRVVHRDVSPSNVLVTYDGATKLVDFGIARAALSSAPSTVTKGLKGKVAYMSPEQCRGKTLDRRSDLFSVGTILYELTTGQQPFADQSRFATLERIVGTDPTPPSHLVPSYPDALERIVLRALAREPDQRYSTALELQGHLEDFAHETRLRVSPLVVARLMSTLFPARLEEWERARAQGAFFVEQTVVRTWIEKTGEGGLPPSGQLAEPPPADEAAAGNDDVGDTTARLPTPAPVQLAPERPSAVHVARVATPPAGLASVARVPTQPPMPASMAERMATPPMGMQRMPTPPAGMARVATPPSGMAAVHRTPTHPPPIPSAARTTPVSALPAVPVAMSFAPASAGTFALPSREPMDGVVERPSDTQFEETKLVRLATRRTPLVIGVFAMMAVVGVVLGLVIGTSGGSSGSSTPAPTPPHANPVTVVMPQTPAPAEPAQVAPTVANPPPTPAPPAPVVPPDLAPPPPAAAVVATPPPAVAPVPAAPAAVPAPHVPVRTVKATPPRPAAKPPKPTTTKPDPDTKETKWGTDSVFLPERPGT